jgi:hypothetical protein
MKPPFSYERFLELCDGWIPGADYHELCHLPEPVQDQDTGERHAALMRWVQFDTAMRNDLVRIRAARKQVDPSRYLRPGGEGGAVITPAGIPGGTSGSLLETEKILDEIRWKALEGFKTNHYFDLEALVPYACQLLILLRWEQIQKADGSALLEHALHGGTGR